MTDDVVRDEIHERVWSTDRLNQTAAHRVRGYGDWRGERLCVRLAIRHGGEMAEVIMTRRIAFGLICDLIKAAWNA